MKRIWTIGVYTLGMLIITCCNSKRDDSLRDEYCDEFIVEESVSDDINVESDTIVDENKKFEAEEQIKVAEERMKMFMAYGLAIEEAASRCYSTYNEDDSDESFQYKQKLHGLSQCMGYFNAIQRRFEYVYQYFQEEDYDGVIRIVNSTFDSFRFAHEHFSKELAEVNLDISVSPDMTSLKESRQEICPVNNVGYQYNPSVVPEPAREPVRQQCRACRGTSDCPVCGGSGQTNSRMGYSYSEGVQALPEKCRSCGGTGKCTACGGDGWLEEGIEF